MCRLTSHLSCGNLLQCLFAVFFLTCLICVENVAAQSALKKYVFEDCVKAKDELLLLRPEEKDDFIQYLGRILELHTDSLREVMSDGSTSYINPPGAFKDALPGLKVEPLLSMFEPSREVEAKKCAVILLRLIGGPALNIVPQLFSLLESSQKTVLNDTELHEAIWSITIDVARNNQMVIDNSLLKYLFSAMDSKDGYLAENILVELHKTSVPFLIETLKSSDPLQQSRIIKVLLRIDHQGKEIGPMIVPLLQSSDVVLKMSIVRLLTRLPEFYQQAIHSLVALIEEPIPEVKEAVLNALEEILSSPEFPTETELPPESLQHLIEILRQQNPKQRKIITLILSRALPRTSDSASSLLKLLEKADQELRPRLVYLLAKLAPPNKEYFRFFADALYEPEIDSRVAAFSALIRFSAHDQDIYQILFSFLKRAAPRGDLAANPEFITELANFIISQPRNRSLERMASYLVDSLAYQESGEPSIIDYPAVIALIHIGPSANALLTKALRSPDVLVRRRAIYCLVGIKPVSKPGIEMLTGMLKDSAQIVRTDAAKALVSLGDSAITELNNALQWPEPESRLLAASVLSVLQTNQADVTLVFNSTFEQISCNSRLDILKIFSELKTHSGLQMQLNLARCIGQEQLDNQVLITNLSSMEPIEPAVSQLLTDYLLSGRLPNTTIALLLDETSLFNLTKEAKIAGVLSLLRDSQSAVIQKALELIAYAELSSPDITTLITEIYKNESLDLIIRDKAAIALATINALDVSVQQYFMERLKSAQRDSAISALLAAKPSFSLPILTYALRIKELSEIQETLLCQLGNLGREGKGALSDLMTLSDSAETPELNRYCSTVSILKIEPSQAERFVRRELIGRYRRRFFAEHFDRDSLVVIEAIKQTPQSFVEQHAAIDILRKAEQ